MNIELTKEIINQLVQLGVRTFCICPGARSAPFLEVLAHSKGLEILSFFDERSCSFFALGRARRDHRPIAIVTTSGTAVAELLPSVIEAYYSGLPLVLLTSDRPYSHREQACPQTIKNPQDLFKDYTYCSLNISEKKDLQLNQWSPQKGHLHLNISFDEPLIDATVSSVDFSKHPDKQLRIYSDSSLPAKEDDFQKFFNSCKQPCILVGELRKEELALVEEFLSKCNHPFYLEPFSQLQHLKNRLSSGEKILSAGVKTKQIDSVIRLGGIPRCRFWRDLASTKLKVLNLASPPFYSGLPNETKSFSLLDNLHLLDKFLSALPPNDSLKSLDKEQTQKWHNILKNYPRSEEAWMSRLKTQIPQHSHIFLGNSLPVRLWDKVAGLSHQVLSVTGQSGVNGIDGLISRFFGECTDSKNHFACIGDLSTLYDLNAFWINSRIPPWTLFTINNGGGQIFSQIFENEIFLNSHQLSFSHLAKLWSVEYQLFEDPDQLILSEIEPRSLLEIRPDQASTNQASRKYVSIWDN